MHTYAICIYMYNNVNINVIAFYHGTDFKTFAPVQSTVLVDKMQSFLTTCIIPETTPATCSVFGQTYSKRTGPGQTMLVKTPPRIWPETI
jgi:hypothetical protein